MILTCFPSVAYSEELSTSLGTESSQSNESSNEISYKTQVYTEDTVIGAVQEIRSLREENVKHFRLDDGTYEAVVYGEAVHRKDKNGEWTDIDNSLYISGEKSSQVYSTADSRVSFAQSFKSGAEIFALRENSYAISMALLSQEKQLSENSSIISATVVNSKQRATNSFNSIEEARRINNITTIVYNDIKQGTNLEYALQGNDIKENIIIYKPGSNYSYSFEINLTGLKATLDSSGNVVITDSKTGENKYYIPAPFMYDSENVYSYDVKYKLQKLSDGKYLLTVDANADWINDSQRAFPVTIDPTLKYYSNINDTFTYSAEPNANYGNSSIMWLSNYYTPYIKIDIPSLPEGATLNRAWLNVYFYYYDNMTSGKLIAGIYPVLSQWNENQLTYSNAPQNSNLVQSKASFSGSVGAYANTPQLSSFSIIKYVKDLYDGNVTNYGFVIKREDNTAATNESVILKASESGTAYSPYISLNYTYLVPEGVYAFKNMYGTSYWMTVGENGAFAGANLQYMTSSVSPADTSVFERSSLFKISQKGNTYIIRSMTNNELSFGVSGNEIITKTIPSNDEDVSLEDTFLIEWVGNGFAISPYGSSKFICIPSNSNNKLSLVSSNNATTNCCWSLDQYTGIEQWGSTIYCPSDYFVGQTVVFSAISWSTSINYNTTRISVDDDYSNYVTCSWNSSEKNASIAFHQPGSFIVKVLIYNGNGVECKTSTFVFGVSLLVSEGDYFIKNKETEMYMQIDNDDDPDYSTSESIMEIWGFDGGLYQKWSFVHIGDGYYKIISRKSGLALCVQSDYIDEDGESVVQEAYSNTSRKQWKITKSSTGSYILRPKSAESYNTDWCLSVGSYLLVASGTNVEQREYANDDNYKDEWTICTFDTSLLLAIDDVDGASRHMYFSSTKTNLQTEKNGKISITSTVRYSSASVATMINYLQSSNIFIVHTHGKQTGFKISNTGTTYITLTDLAEEDLSNLSLALLMTCNTGDNYSPAHITNNTPVNIIEQMVICGAETVVGFSAITWVDDCNKFGSDITYKLIVEGLSVDDAIESITYTSYIKDMSSIDVIAGNGNNKLR